METVEQQLVNLVEALQAREGRPFVRCIIEPNGEIEVNARVIYRGDTHPTVIYVDKREES